MVHPVYIGCDVAKAHLDLFDAATQTYIRIANTVLAIDEWLATLGRREACVILEATGRYDRLLCTALERRQPPYCRVNPARACDFARATGQLDKTDSIAPEAQAVMFSPMVCGCGGRGVRLDRRHQAEKCFQSDA